MSGYAVMDRANAVHHLFVFGAGGHGREIAWLAAEALPGAKIEFVVDGQYHRGGLVNGIPVRDASEVVGGPGVWFVTAVGDPAVRRRAVQFLTGHGLRATALIHPRAIVAPNAVIEEGAVVCAGSIVSDQARVGPHAVVNIGCTISHDVSLGAFATVSPGVHIAGNVDIGEGATLGVGASVINGTSSSPLIVGTGATVGAGATVIRDVAPGTVVVGVPARPIHDGENP